MITFRSISPTINALELNALRGHQILSPQATLKVICMRREWLVVNRAMRETRIWRHGVLHSNFHIIKMALFHFLNKALKYFSKSHDEERAAGFIRDLHAGERPGTEFKR